MNVFETYKQAKEAFDEAKAILDEAERQLDDYTQTHQLPKGIHEGIAIKYTDFFSDRNVELAEQHHIPIPYKNKYTLKMQPDRIDLLKDEGIITDDDIATIKVVDKTTLKRRLKKEKIPFIANRKYYYSLTDDMLMTGAK